MLNRVVQPFSFMGSIFVEKERFLSGEISSLILDHEYAHVRERHTYDIILAEIAKVIFWFNPFVHSIRKEIELNHEFIADEYVLRGSGNKKDYLKLMVGPEWMVESSPLISNNSFKLVKSRIQMLTTWSESIRKKVLRVGMLLLVFSTMLFYACTHEVTLVNPKSDKYLVVVDPGHGGLDPGVNGSGILEKDVVLQISKLVPRYISNDQIVVKFTREEDKFVGLEERVVMSTDWRADLFVSVHFNAQPGKPEKTATEIYYPNEGKQSPTPRIFAFGPAFNAFDGLREPDVRTAGFWVLKRSKCPAVLIELDYLTNKAVQERALEEDYQHVMAKRIAKVIEGGYDSWLQKES